MSINVTGPRKRVLTQAQKDALHYLHTQKTPSVSLTAMPARISTKTLITLAECGLLSVRAKLTQKARDRLNP